MALGDVVTAANQPWQSGAGTSAGGATNATGMGAGSATQQPVLGAQPFGPPPTYTGPDLSYLANNAVMNNQVPNNSPYKDQVAQPMSNDPLVNRYKDYTPSNPYVDPNMLIQLGLTNANYQQQYGDYTNAYNINQQQQALRNQLTGLDANDIRSQQRDVAADQAYWQRLKDLNQADIGSYNTDRGTYANQLANTLSGITQDTRMANFNTQNKYIAGGGQFSPGLAVNLGNNFSQALNKGASAQLSNDLQNTALDRSINGANQSIARSDRELAQSNNSLDRLNNALTKNGLNMQLGNLSMDELKNTFQQRINQLGINRFLDSSKIIQDASSNDPQAAAQALNWLKQIMPDLISGGGNIPQMPTG